MTTAKSKRSCQRTSWDRPQKVTRQCQITTISSSRTDQMMSRKGRSPSPRRKMTQLRSRLMSRAARTGHRSRSCQAARQSTRTTCGGCAGMDLVQCFLSKRMPCHRSFKSCLLRHLTFLRNPCLSKMLLLPQWTKQGIFMLLALHSSTTSTGCTDQRARL